MARKVIWSARAHLDRREILHYWLNRNKSNTYSKKLNKLFVDAVRFIRDYPQIGNPTDLPNVRIKAVRDYLVVYEVSETQITILAIWDSRQNPVKFPHLDR